jgi:D-glycero-alpha-D-manno-heptose 1-phosphate guanylyltransferase
MLFSKEGCAVCNSSGPFRVARTEILSANGIVKDNHGGIVAVEILQSRESCAVLRFRYPNKSESGDFGPLHRCARTHSCFRAKTPVSNLSRDGSALSLWRQSERMEDNPDIPSGAVYAFILCGGLGTRLRPLLADRPKSMALIAGIPFLQLLIEKLKCEGFDQVILGTGYMAEKIESHFGRGNHLALRISYSREDKPLGTGGAVKLAEPYISDPVLILNGDSYVDWSLVPMLELLTAKDAVAVMVVQAVADVSRYGSVALDCDSRITHFIEKGICAGPGLINAGVYLLRKKVVRDLPTARTISLEKDVFPRLLDRKVYGLVCTGPFIDIGIPDDFRRAQTVLASQAKAASQ